MHILRQETSDEVRRANAGLLRALGLFSTTLFVIGAVIGSGIFVKPGLMASQLGSAEWLLAVWVIAGVITLLGALVNAEVAAMIPEAGGQYVYFDRMYGSFPAYLYGWSVFAVLKTGGLASLAFVFSQGLAQFFQLPDLPGELASWTLQLPVIGHIAFFENFGGKLVAMALILSLTVVNYCGVKFGSLVQNIFALAKASALVLIVLVAWFAPERTDLAPAVAVERSAISPLTGLALVMALAAAVQGAFWAYEGWNDVTYLAGEIKEPQRTLPRGLIMGMVIVMACYILTNIAYLSALSVDEMAGSKLVAADVVERFFEGGGKWIAVAVIISTFGAANSNVLAPARVFMAMARRQSFPSSLGVVHPKFHTPGRALILQAIWSMGLVLSGTFDVLTNTLVFVSWIFYAAGAAGIFVLRRKEPNTPRPYKAPGYPILPAIFIVFAATFLVLTVFNDTSNYFAALAAGKPALNHSAFGVFLVLMGSPIYFICRARARAAALRPASIGAAGGQ